MLVGPVRGQLVCLDNRHWYQMPTADQIAAAVVAAAAEFGLPPERILKGFGPWQDGWKHKRYGELRQEAKRARFYAMLAICEVLPEAPHANVARCLGVKPKSSKSYWSNAVFVRERGTWWNEEAFQRVVQAVRDRLGIAGTSGEVGGLESTTRRG